MKFVNKFTVRRSIAGPVLLQFGDILNGFQVAMTDSEAMGLCDALRRIIESPTQAAPSGENVVVMQLSDS